MAELLSQRLTEHVDSDEGSRRSGKRSHRGDSDDETHRSPKRSRKEVKQEDETQLQEVLQQLEIRDLSELPFSKQILLLYALFRAVQSLECVKTERERRTATLNTLLLEESSIQSQMQELQAVYVPQEQRLRDAFIAAVEGGVKQEKQQTMMLGKRYNPSEKSKLPSEVALATFLAKKKTVFDDMTRRLAEIREQLLSVNASAGELNLLGKDRLGRSYYFFPEDTPSRLWICDKRRHRWSYLWSSAQLQQLLAWIDNRGSQEHVLYCSLVLYLPMLKRTLDESLRSVPTLGEAETPQTLPPRRRRELETHSLVLRTKEGVEELLQTKGKWIGVPMLPDVAEDCVVVPGRVSLSLFDITSCLFVPLFLKPSRDESLISSLQTTLQTVYCYPCVALETYKEAVLQLERAIMATIQPTYIHPDWLVARSFWTKRVAAARNYSEVSFYLRDIEVSCVDFAIVNALTTTVSRPEFFAELERQGKKVPAIPEEGETVVYYAAAHALAIRDFKQHNVFSGVVDLKEKEQAQDFVCKVQSIRYFPGRGNAFVQMTLRPVQNTVVSVLVRSFYASQELPSFTVSYPESFPAAPSAEPFEVILWANNTESDCVISLSKYFTAFANNLHVEDAFKMYFQGIESQVPVSKKRRHDARLEGSFLHGHVMALAPATGDVFPWDSVTVRWDANAGEAGTNRINPWECEFTPKDVSLRAERARELGSARSVARQEGRRLSEEELKTVRAKAAEAVRTHTKQDGEDFFRFLESYWGKQGMEVTRPVLSYEPLDLGLLWKLMQIYGGYECVVNTKGSWLEIYRLLPTYRSQNTSAPTSLHKIYLKYMWQFEKEQREEKGLPPIIEPRLPLPTTPGRIVLGKAGKTEEFAEGENKTRGERATNELTLVDAPPGVQFMERILREEEKKKAVLMMKWKAMNATLQYEPGTISTVNGEERDYAYQGIVNGSVCVLKRKIEIMTKFLSSLKQIMNFYI